jgi:hypothetical protein
MKHLFFLFLSLFMLAGGTKAEQTPVDQLQTIDPLTLTQIDQYLDCYIAVVDANFQKRTPHRIFDFTTIIGNKLTTVDLTQANRYDEGLIFRVQLKRNTEDGKKYFLFQQKSTGSFIAENVVARPASEYETGNPGATGGTYWDLKVGYDAVNGTYAIGHPTETTWNAHRNRFTYDWTTEKMGYTAKTDGEVTDFIESDFVFYFLEYKAPVEPIIKLSAKGLAFDQNVREQRFTIEAINITGGLEVIAADEIDLSDFEFTVDSDGSVNAEVIASYQDNAEYTGTLTVQEFDNPNVAVSIPVNYRRDEFVPTYGNMVPGGGYMNSFAGFNNGWGYKSIVSAADDDVYSGSSCAKITGKTTSYPDGGSIDIPVRWVPGAYHIRAWIRTVDGSFQMGLQKCNADNDTDLNFPVPQSGDNWVYFDKAFVVTRTIGEEVADADLPVVFFNNHNTGGTVAYIDNWEIFREVDPVIDASVTGLAFDQNATEATFTVNGANITGSISVTTDVPELDISIPFPLTAGSDGNVIGGEVSVSYTGNASSDIDGTITLTNGNVSTPITVKIRRDAFVPHSGNINPDPYLNDLANYGGWGKKSIVSILDEDVIYSGARCAKIAGTGNTYSTGGSIDFHRIGEFLQTETTYRIRARIKTVDGSFVLGISGLNAAGDSASMKDYLIPQSTDEWIQFDGCFTTEIDFVTSANMYFNNDGDKGATGKLAYIDNWEVYPDPTAVDPSALNKISVSNTYAYASRKLITVKSSVPIQQVQAYSLQGALIYASGELNATSHSFNASNTGVYIVKLITENGVSNLKVLVK